jgi:hypothetical protein
MRGIVRIFTVLFVEGDKTQMETRRNTTSVRGARPDFIGTRKGQKPSTREGLLHEGATAAGQMIQLKGCEIAKVLLDEIGRAYVWS